MDMRLRLALIIWIGFLFMIRPAWSEEARTNELLDALKSAPENGWEAIEAQLLEEWSRSGSAALDFLLERGRSAIASEDTVSAIEHLTVLVEAAPTFAEGWNARATAYFHADMLGPALSDIAHVLALEPQHFGAITGLGLILEETGDPERAMAAYQAAIAIHPRRPDLREAVQRLEAGLAGKRI